MEIPGGPITPASPQRLLAPNANNAGPQTRKYSVMPFRWLGVILTHWKCPWRQMCTEIDSPKLLLVSSPIVFKICISNSGLLISES